MKHMEKMKFAIMVLLGLCLVCAAAAFFLPNIYGMVLSCLAIAFGSVVAVLCLAGMAVLMRNHQAAV